ncbi:MAG: hypothetical protein ACRDX9_10250 [Acidimicrobiia bacterium]
MANTLNVHGAQSAIYDRYEAMEPRPEVVLLDVGATVDTSVTVLDVMFETDQHLRRSGSGLWVASIPLKAEEKARRTEAWPEWVAAGKIHSSVAAAVAAYESGSTAASQS